MKADNLSYLLLHLSNVLTKQIDELLQQNLDIGLSQYKILMVLEWNPRIGQRSIASSLGQTEASISRQIKLLKKRGLIITKADPTNKRRHMNTPTPQAMQLTEAARDLLKRDFSSEFNQLDETKLTQLNDNLQQLHKIVCKPGKPGACDHQFNTSI